MMISSDTDTISCFRPVMFLNFNLHYFQKVLIKLNLVGNFMVAFNIAPLEVLGMRIELHVVLIEDFEL